MSPAICAREGCGKALDVRATDRPPLYCSAACRVAALRSRRADQAGPVAVVAIPVLPAPQRPSTAGAVTKRPREARRFGLLCPVNPAHGPLLDWPTDRWAYHCPHRDHDGYGHDVPPTRAFFTTSEAESGDLRTDVGEAGPPAGDSDVSSEPAGGALAEGEAGARLPLTLGLPLDPPTRAGANAGLAGSLDSHPPESAASSRASYRSTGPAG